MKQAILKVLLFLLILPLNQINAATTCKDSANYMWFRNEWNNRVGIFKESSWELPEINLADQKNDTLQLTHVLTHSGITFMASIAKSGCIKKITLLINKNANVDMPALISSLNLMDIFNPEVESSKRQSTLEELKTESKDKKTTSMRRLGNTNYMYESGKLIDVFALSLI